MYRKDDIVMSKEIKVEFYDEFNSLKDTYEYENFSDKVNSDIEEKIKERNYAYALILDSFGKIRYIKHKDFSLKELLNEASEQ